MQKTMQAALAYGARKRPEPAQPPRTVRLTLTLADDNGVVKVYRVTPTQTRGAFQSYKLRHGERTYHCRLDDDGLAACSCPAGNFGKSCKHVAALAAVGLFHRDAVLQLRRRELLTPAPVRPESTIGHPKGL